MKTVFWGTPQVAVPFLDALSKITDIVGIVTQTDKPEGRGQKIHPTPVKVWAQAHGVPVLQPTKLKDPVFLEQLAAWKGELGMAVAYGRLIPNAALDLFPKGVFNIHFSMLPHLRGAAPMQWALLRGDKESGVTCFRIVQELDAGAILLQKAMPVDDRDDAHSLEAKLTELGLGIQDEAIRLLKEGKAVERPQVGEPTFAPLLEKEQARLDWTQSAIESDRRVRALLRMGAYCHLPDGRHLKVTQAQALPGNPADGSVFGAIVGVERGRGPVVQCKEGRLLLLRVRAEGKKETDGWSFWQGAHLKLGDRMQ